MRRLGSGGEESDQGISAGRKRERRYILIVIWCESEQNSGEEAEVPSDSVLMMRSRQRGWTDPAESPEAPPFMPHGQVVCASPIFSEPLCLLEFLFLWLSPICKSSTAPAGDGSGAVLIPGLLGLDINLFALHAWLGRIGYRSYYSGMGIMADCPNDLARRLDQTIDRAYAETGRRVHLIGHSLGGIFARSAAVRRPGRIASVISLGSPFRGLVMHRVLSALSETTRGWIRQTRPEAPNDCASSRCSCEFGRSLGRRWPRSVRQTAVYTRCDGLVDWRYCLSGKPNVDVEVVATHLGLLFNPEVFGLIARRLAGAASG